MIYLGFFSWAHEQFLQPHFTRFLFLRIMDEYGHMNIRNVRPVDLLISIKHMINWMTGEFVSKSSHSINFEWLPGTDRSRSPISIYIDCNCLNVRFMILMNRLTTFQHLLYHVICRIKSIWNEALDEATIEIEMTEAYC